MTSDVKLDGPELWEIVFGATQGGGSEITDAQYSDIAETIDAVFISAKDAEIERLRDLIRWAHDTLYEINPSNYDHDEVCRINDASVEVILGLAPTLGERHGKSAEWRSERADLKDAENDQ